MTSAPKLLLSALLLVAACKGKKADTTVKNVADSAGAKIDGSLCETKSRRVVEFDLNKDGKPDVWRLYNGDVQTCKQVDFDHDGRTDWVEAYDASGRPLYQKADFDYDGKFDMLAVLDANNGEPTEVERDTDFDGKFDVKEIYDTAGALSNIRRDRNGDSQPDQWEQYKNTILVAILYDENFDGRVDRREEIPGATPKVEMPTTQDPTASGAISPDAKGAQPAPKK